MSAAARPRDRGDRRRAAVRAQPTSPACASSSRPPADADVDAAVAAAATAAGIWVNAADQPADCSFILPAIARNGPLAVAVSTGGASPALARRLRDHAAALLTDEVVALALDLQARRAAVRAAGGSTEDVDWSGLIDPVLPPPR